MKTSLSTPPLWLVNLTALCVCITLSLALIYSYADSKAKASARARNDAYRALPRTENLAENPFDSVVLAGKASIVFDVSRNRSVFEQNAEAQMPLASLTKLMTAVIVAETLPEYTAVEILPREKERDVKLKVGERWSLKELLAYTLMTSSNSGADSMAAAASSYLGGKGTFDTRTQGEYPSLFIEKMNAKARTLGLNQTYFLNPSGLDTSNETSGAYGSARDVAFLLAYIVNEHPDLLAATGRTSQIFIAPDGRKVEARNTNESAVTIPGIIGSKTGLTDLAGGNLAIAFDASFGEPFIVVVLNSTQEERFTDIEKLVAATIDYLGAGLKSPAGAMGDNEFQKLPDISYNPIP